jgi:hypothetical protein
MQSGALTSRWFLRQSISPLIAAGFRPNDRNESVSPRQEQLMFRSEKRRGAIKSTDCAPVFREMPFAQGTASRAYTNG